MGESDRQFSHRSGATVGERHLSHPAGLLLFGAIGDTSPDSWGPCLMRRAEQRLVERAGHQVRTLGELQASPFRAKLGWISSVDDVPFFAKTGWISPPFSLSVDVIARLLGHIDTAHTIPYIEIRKERVLAMYAAALDYFCVYTLYNYAAMLV